MPSTDLEQLMLELVNEARLDPGANPSRYLTSYTPLTSAQPNIQNALTGFNVPGATLLSQYSALTATQPVAFSDPLVAAARTHNGVMISTDSQTHQAPGEPDLAARYRAQGYNFTTAGENVFAYADDILYGHAAFMVDWGGPDGIQAPPGHRDNIMNPAFREVGIGVTPESNPATQVGNLVITQNFGTRGGTAAFILGVAYADADNNNFYSLGEGRNDLTVSVAGASVVSGASGGYTLGTNATGAQRITLAGAGLNGPVTVDAALANGQNVKLDVVNGATLRTSVSGFVSGPIAAIQVIGTAGLALATDDAAHAILGAGGADTLTGGAAGDTLRGGGGADRLTGRGGADLILGNTGSDDLAGNTGQDSLFGGQDADRVYGGQDADALFGNLGDDTLYGNLGADTLSGGQGRDILFGGQNDDVLNGNLGDDTLVGGLGADRFVFAAASGSDLIGGFDPTAGDRIVLGGQTFTTGQATDGSALLGLSGGGFVTVTGFTAAQVEAGWFA